MGMPVDSIKSVPKADDVYYEEAIEKVNIIIQNLKQEIKDITTQIDELSESKDDFNSIRADHLNKIEQINTDIRALVSERDSILGKLGSGSSISESQAKPKSTKFSLEPTGSSGGFSSIDELEQRIEQLKYEMMVSSISLNEEKKLVIQIEKLSRFKPELIRMEEERMKEIDVSEVPSKKAADTLSNPELKAKLNQIRGEIDCLRESRLLEDGRFQKLLEEKNASQLPLRELFEKRDELRRSMGGHTGRLAELKAEWRRKDLEFRAYKAQLKSTKLESERWEKQKQRLDKEKNQLYAQLALLRDDDIYDSKASMAKGLIAYLKGLMLQEAGSETSVSVPETKFTPEIITTEAGTFKVMHKDRVTAILNKKRVKSNYQKGVNDTVVHSLDTLRDFAKLGIQDYPIKLSDCPSTIEKLQTIIDQQKDMISTQLEAQQAKRAVIESRLSVLLEKEASINSSKIE